jgi:hypothetical protein
MFNKQPQGNQWQDIIRWLKLGLLRTNIVLTLCIIGCLHYIFQANIFVYEIMYTFHVYE